MSILNSYLVTSRLLRPFDPREYNTPNCSKTERHGVQKTLVERILRGFLLFKTSKMVTFGHHFENGGSKNGKKRV